MKPNKNSLVYATLVSAAAVDGGLVRSEKVRLAAFRRRLGLSAAEGKKIVDRVLRGKKTLFVPDSSVGRARLFGAIRNVLEADGGISGSEARHLRRLRKRMAWERPVCARCSMAMRSGGGTFSCRECGALWLRVSRRGIRSGLVSRMKRWLRSHPRTGSSSADHPCPDCARTLTPLRISGRSDVVSLEQCPECRGVLAEVDERRRLIAIAREGAGRQYGRGKAIRGGALLDAFARAL